MMLHGRVQAWIFSLLAATLIFLGAGRLVAAPEDLPRFKVRVTCFDGVPGESGFGSGTSYGLDGTLYTQGQMTCGVPGQVSEITWSFVKRRGDKDVYSVTRRFPVDVAGTVASSKEVEFSTKQVVVFQDEHQTVVFEPPTK